MAAAGVGALQVAAVPGPADVRHETLVHVQAGPVVLLQSEARPAAALHGPHLPVRKMNKILPPPTWLQT